MNQEEVSASCLQLAFCGCSRGNSCINRQYVPVLECGDERRNISLDEEEV